MTKLYARFGLLVGVVGLLAIANMLDILSLGQREDVGRCDIRQHIYNARLPPGDQGQVVNIKPGGTGAPPVLSERLELAQGPRMTGKYHKLTLISDRPTTNHQWPWTETKQAVEMCNKQDFHDNGPLPNISAVICFHNNENVSVILHTIHSIVQRTPPDLLHEVVLVDDNSIKDDLKGILEVYCQANFGSLVKIFRSSEQLGLIKARLYGIQKSTGDVIAIMDSHVEVQKLWAEPLLYEIKKNRKTLAASYLDWVTPTATGYEYKHGGTTWKTYFDWGLVFGWQAMSQSEIRERNNLIKPLPVPVTIGTIYMIDRKYFHEVGAFDPGMELWGGENLDLPVRIWMCGGQVIQHPCSRAGHVEFPKGRDYRHNWDKIIHRNYKRFAEVWMDDYKKYVFQQYPELPGTDVGDLSARRALREKCPHDFSWYLDTIYPELGIPDKSSFAHGGGFYWTTNMELRFPIHVFKTGNMGLYTPDKDGIGLLQDEYTSNYKQNRTDEFIHWRGGPIYNIKLDQCVEHTRDRDIRMKPCDLQDPRQLWEFNNYSPYYFAMMEGEPRYALAHKLVRNVKQTLEGGRKRAHKGRFMGVTDSVPKKHRTPGSLPTGKPR